MGMTEEEAYQELTLYTLEHAKMHQEFIHQHVVDAYAAQHAAENEKPTTTWFALIGLYLMLEKGYTGRQVQLAHMELAKRRKEWPHLEAPDMTGTMRVTDVLAAPAGPTRDAAIREWCESVWSVWSVCKYTIDRALQ